MTFNILLVAILVSSYCFMIQATAAGVTGSVSLTNSGTGVSLFDITQITSTTSCSIGGNQIAAKGAISFKANKFSVGSTVSFRIQFSGQFCTNYASSQMTLAVLRTDGSYKLVTGTNCIFILSVTDGSNTDLADAGGKIKVNAFLLSTLSSTSSTSTTSSTTTAAGGLTALDIAILNFALNLEYLEAEFYLAAVGRVPSYENLVTGTVTGGAQVSFSDPALAQYANEIATDEENHVLFLRSVLGNNAIDRPNINIAGGANGAFGQAALAAAINAGLDANTQAALAQFSPYANDLYFLHGAFIFEDVGVTAYKGAIKLFSNGNLAGTAGGILGVEAYHASEIRTLLYNVRSSIAIAANTVGNNAAVNVQSLIGAISLLRAALDGSGNGGHDQSIVVNSQANIVPADSNSIAFSRTARQVLNIVYGGQNAAMGLFFPNGLKGQLAVLLAAST